MAAIDARDPRAVAKLLKSGVDPNAFPNSDAELRAEHDFAPINAAASESAEIVGLLLDNGADPNQGDGWNFNPLSAAGGREEILRLLIKRGAKVNDLETGSSALWRAAVDGKVGAVRFLLAHGANPNTRMFTTRDQSLLSALRELNGSLEIIRLLKKAGARD